MLRLTLVILFGLTTLLLSPVAIAQGTGVSFGVLQTDTSQPVDITSDNLSVNQEDGSALLTGNVLIIQGEMRLSADNVLVVRKTDGNGIERLEARGNVLLVSGEDAAEARTADYTIENGTVVMRGDVLLTQKGNTLGAEQMTVNLTTGNATLNGRVRTTLPGSGGD
ncbi:MULTISPECIES: lipopolysaccharide transport periplasmic protein LptA [Tritonibacter]|uniref:Lipopolysaccharide export system protein LptA n=1 Tax=Tritonibacter scottomollicae TaxID=483013 RepID=A0A2T1ALP4_TRISK|nr:lipopolysaccharide transport periplasmic protein LptA [Tritonibacter scottomollicae]PRZ49494.1 lipopolysaccharide export system protein LptA [Tritonibacter scottomollicae]